jgi:hypothetical protein
MVITGSPQMEAAMLLPESANSKKPSGENPIEVFWMGTVDLQAHVTHHVGKIQYC